MTERQILIIKTTWAYVIVNSEEAGMLFYKKLFELDHSLKSLFKGDIKEQAKKLMSTVTLIVTKLDKLSEIEQEVKALGKRHVDYGTRPEHYATVGQALLWTLEKGLREKWTPEVKEAWFRVYSILAHAMLNADSKHATA